MGSSNDKERVAICQAVICLTLIQLEDGAIRKMQLVLGLEPTGTDEYHSNIQNRKNNTLTMNAAKGAMTCKFLLQRHLSFATQKFLLSSGSTLN